MRKKSAVFNVLYKRDYWTGSHADGLRVEDANEFDLNLVLDLSVLWRHVEVLRTPHGGYVNARVPKEAIEPSLRRLKSALPVPDNHRFHGELQNIVRKLFNDHPYGDYYHLDSDNVRRWMNSLVDQVRPEIEEISPNRLISGPAVTVRVRPPGVVGGPPVDVDLVAVFVDRTTYNPRVRISF